MFEFEECIERAICVACGMEVEIKELEPMRLVGHRVRHRLAEAKTFLLWNGFGKACASLELPAGTPRYSVSQYDNFSPSEFTPLTEFTQWASLPWPSDRPLPEGMEELILEGGKYAVFLYEGVARNFPVILGEFYGEWLPQSGEQLGQGPHFEVLDHRYLGPENPKSVEEVWIPLI